MKRTSGIIMVTVGLVLVAVALASINQGGNSDPTDNSPSPQVGRTAPDFELTSVSGQSVKLSDYHGKVVLVNFWAVWCPPCREELPDLQQAHEQYGDELVVLTVNTGDAAADVIEYLNSNGLTMETLLDSNYRVNDQYRVTGLPTSFFIDEQGVIQYIQIGILNQAALMEYLSAMGVTD